MLIKDNSQIILLNNPNVTDFPEGFDHDYTLFNGSLSQLKSLQLDPKSTVSACRSIGAYTTTLPSFLLGANNYAYYAAPLTHGDGNNFPGDDAW